nr:hypothetical protein [Myxococcota bacterium]
RQGSGYEVRDFRRTGGPDLLRELLALASGPRLESATIDLLLVRRQLARAVIEKLLERPIRARARTAIEASVDALEQAVASGARIGEVADADLAVVASILEATDSAVLQLCMNPVAAIVAGVPRLRDAIYADATDSVLGWRGLLAWLEAPSPAGMELVLGAMAARDAQTIERLRSAPRARRKTR